jgi:hypothetical protein
MRTVDNIVDLASSISLIWTEQGTMHASYLLFLHYGFEGEEAGNKSKKVSSALGLYRNASNTLCDLFGLNTIALDETPHIETHCIWISIMSVKWWSAFEATKSTKEVVIRMLKYNTNRENCAECLRDHDSPESRLYFAFLEECKPPTMGDPR